MNWQDFQAKKVALLGAGKDNLSLIPHLQKVAADLTIFDWSPPQTNSFDLPIVSGPDYLKKLDGFDWAFRSPGFPVKTLTEACGELEHPPKITSAIDLFLALAPCPTIGVTGTKGKGTTCTMIGSILNSSGREALVMGNIGEPVFDFYTRLTADSLAILELSSFMLEDITHSPKCAAVLAISQDHLQPLSESSPNFHPTMEDYVAAKGNITKFQSSGDLLVFNSDNEYARSIADTTQAKKISVASRDTQADYQVDEQGLIHHKDQVLVDLASLGLRGQHIFINACTAVAVAREFGATDEGIEEGLKNFKPLPHRLETFLVREGVTFVDDSYATAPDAAAAALTAFDAPLIWIAGGSRKGADFSGLARAVARKQPKKIILLGQEAERLKEALVGESEKLAVTQVQSLAEAVEAALTSAQSGDVVLLSPACASKDMFKDAADRGTQFQAAVKEWHADA